MGRSTTKVGSSEFAQTLRAKRLERGLSLRQVGELAGLSEAQLSRLERDEVGPSRDSVAALAQALGLDTMLMLRLSGLLEPPPAGARVSSVSDAVMADVRLTQSQKDALLQTYWAMVKPAGRVRG